MSQYAAANREECFMSDMAERLISPISTAELERRWHEKKLEEDS